MIEGIDLKPQFLGNDPDTVKYEAAIARPGNFEAFEYFAVWLSNNIGYGGMANMAIPYALPRSLKYPNCQDISVCFDGSWIRNDDGFKFITDPLPTIAICQTDGSIRVHQVVSDTYHTIPGDYKYVAIIRGWKSLIDDTDQKLTVFAANETGVDRIVYNITSEGNTWSLEEHIERAGLCGLKAGLLADYRICAYLYTEEEGTIETECICSDRQYIGGAAPPEFANMPRITGSNIRVVLNTIEHSTLTPSTEQYAMLAPQPLVRTHKVNICCQPREISAINTDKFTIDVTLGTEVTIASNILKYLSVENVMGVPLIIQAVENMHYGIRLTCIQFNNYVGDFTIRYSGTALKLLDGKAVDLFETTFSPVGLEPDDIPLPELQYITNKELSSIGI